MKTGRENRVASFVRATFDRVKGKPRRTLNVFIVDDEAQLFKDKVALWQDEAFLEKPCSVRGLMEAVSLLLFGQVDSPQPAR